MARVVEICAHYAFRSEVYVVERSRAGRVTIAE